MAFHDKYVDLRGKPLTSMLDLQVESSVAHFRLAGQRLPHVAHPTGMHDPAQGRRPKKSAQRGKGSAVPSLRAVFEASAIRSDITATDGSWSRGLDSP